MFLIDDMFLRALGIELPGLDLIWTISQIKDMAFKQLYDPDKIKSQIKENRMLFEFGEISRDKYEKANSDLLRKLQMAQRGEEMNLKIRSDILGAR